MANDNVQHGIDDNPKGDAGKGAALGGVGGAVVGALAGGPVGAVIGAVAGAAASGAGVAAVDQVDNDNTISGVGDGATRDVNNTMGAMNTPATGQVGTGTMGTDADLTPGNNVPGVQTGGVTTAGADTRGLTEKAADALTGDRTDDKTGGRVV